MSLPVSIKGVLLDDDAVVLLENERGEWELPGGRLEAGEDPPSCLARECAEELGIDVAVGPILDSWVYPVLPERSVLIVTYGLHRRGGGALRVSAEHRRFGRFALADIDRLPMPEGYRRAVRDWAERQAEPAARVVARELQAIAQAGLNFAGDPFDVERYERVRAIAAALMAPGFAATPTQFVDLFRAEYGYPTPKIGVRGAIFRDDCVLLVREVSDGKWAMPGGWAEVNCSLGENVVREIHEETGFTARAVKLAAIWDRRRETRPPAHPFHVYKAGFLCEITGGAARPSIETSAVAFFPLDALPELSPGRSTETQIRRLYAHHRNPGLPTDFA